MCLGEYGCTMYYRPNSKRGSQILKARQGVLAAAWVTARRNIFVNKQDSNKRIIAEERVTEMKYHIYGD